MPDPLTALSDLVLPAATARFVLLANHVLTAAAPVAPARLKPHAGRVLQVEVENWRGPFPPPALSLRVTPAGLFEAVEPGEQPAPQPDLRLRVDASQPFAAATKLAQGEMPLLQIEGDVGFAADVNWVIANVRWDIAADLEKVVGPTLAEGLTRAGTQVLGAARQVANGVASVLRRP